jgi:hypothetical protein
LTKAVVAMLVSLSAVEGVGACGSPVKTGEASGALRLSAVVTKAVVARAVVESPGVWVVPIVPVGSVGVPVKVGEARLALRSRAACKLMLPETAPVMSAKATEVNGVTQVVS